MSLQYITKELLDIEEGTIIQQVNCKGAMGSGLARAISLKYPKVKEDYIEFCKGSTDIQLLGTGQIIKINDNLYIGNLFAQLEFGRTGERYTDYCALKSALRTIYLATSVKGFYIPYYLGCGLGGGDWKTVERIIEYVLPDAIIVKSPSIRYET